MFSFVMSIEHLKIKYFNAERSAMSGTVGRYIMCTKVTALQKNTGVMELAIMRLAQTRASWAGIVG